MRLISRIQILVLTALFLLAGGASAHAFSVNAVRFGDHPDKIRMVLELNEVQAFRAFAMADPWRLVIDMPAFDWQVGNIDRPKGAQISSVRQGALQPGISRIVIDFEHPVAINNAFILPRDAAHNKPDRLVVDFRKVSTADFAAQSGKVFGKLQAPGLESVPQAAVSIPAPMKQVTNKTVAMDANPKHTLPGAIPVPSNKPQAPKAYEPKAPAEMQVVNVGEVTTAKEIIEDRAETGQIVSLATPPVPERKPEAAAPAAPVTSHKKPIIVIDAGHGGVDPGALGANGVSEKHVTLSMARTLKEELERAGRYKVLLTRDKDNYLKLYKRVDIARQHNADLFISLHADSIGKANVQGASVYTLSDKASDEQTALLADRENRADLIAGIKLDTNDKEVATILVDLTMRDTMNQSRFFANKLVSHLEDNRINMLDNPHRYAGFAVLKAPDIPSILVEMGFMSNPREAAQLAKPEYQRTLSKALVKGIDAYFSKIQQMQRS